VAILFVGGVEALQMFVPGRHARLSEFIAHAVSVCAGLAMASIRRS
jgi:VanZ family protein